MMIKVTKIIHTPKILTYILLVYWSTTDKKSSPQWNFRDHNLLRAAEKIILSEILDWRKQKTWNMIFIFYLDLQKPRGGGFVKQ